MKFLAAHSDMMALVTIHATAWGWLALKVIAQERNLAELKARLDAMREECRNRLEWIRSVDQRINEIGDKVSRVLGLLEK